METQEAWKLGNLKVWRLGGVEARKTGRLEARGCAKEVKEESWEPIERVLEIQEAWKLKNPGV